MSWTKVSGSNPFVENQCKSPCGHKKSQHEDGGECKICECTKFEPKGI